VVCAVLLAVACAQKGVMPPPLGTVLEPDPPAEELLVTASAYNSHVGQTDGTPSEAAWGDRLRSGMKAIAVSQDLLARGLKRGTKVQIDGLPGEYTVLDLMHSRWKNHIDIYMGKDRRSALRWGRRKVRISWLAPDEN
jgi:3D (Asp-Asp-Asp) domain-containing protein